MQVAVDETQNEAQSGENEYRRYVADRERISSGWCAAAAAVSHNSRAGVAVRSQKQDLAARFFRLAAAVVVSCGIDGFESSIRQRRRRDS